MCVMHMHMAVDSGLDYGLEESYKEAIRVKNPREIRNHRSRISVYYAVALNLQVPTRTPPYCVSKHDQ
jgi:hypothetical protein